MAYTIKNTPVGSGQVDISSIIQWQSINLTLQATKQVSQLQFNIQNMNARTIPAIGSTIDVYDGANHIFGGIITERVLSVDGGLLSTYAITAVDWGFNFDSKMVVKTYTNEDAGNIVLDIISNFTTGFTGVNVDLTGFLLPSIQFNYQPPSKCLQKLATLIGWDWYIDPSKDVHFFDAETNPAPFNLSDNDGNHIFNTLTIDTSIQNMKNSVYVIGGTYPKTYTALTTPDTYKTDGAKLIFPLAYSYDPTTVAATLAGSAQTIGIDGKDNPASFQVLYNAGQNGVGAFFRFPTAPTTGQTFLAYGNAQIPVLAHIDNDVSIAAYGEYQDSVVDKLITSVAEAETRAQAEIDLYATPTVQLNFSTLTTGLYVGQTISVQSTKLGISSQSFTIKEIQVTANSHDQLIYAVTGQATDNVSMIDLMTLLLEAELMQNTAPASAILENLLTVLEAMTIAESITVSTSTGPYLWGTMIWGFFTWA